MAAAVTIKLDRETLFVGAYVPVEVRIDPGSETTVDDYEFVVPTGAAGGIVSPARGPKHTPTEPTIMLLGGYEPGTHVVQVLEKATGAVVDEAKYELTTVWVEERVGPGVWFSGSPTAHLAGSAWGGGPSGPQNVGTVPALGTRRIALLLVDTTSERFTTDPAALQGHRDRWMDETINGVVSGGQTRSTRAFFREMSYGKFDLSAQVFGPVSLGTDWSTNFNADGTPKGAYFQAAITAADGLIDYDDFDSVVCVSQSADGSSAWPYASIGSWGPYATAEGQKNLGVVSMPNEWGVAGDREIHETLAHELGHNLGLWDQYAPSVAGRNVGGWDLMHADDPFPHVSAAHRMMLGWTPGSAVRSFNFAGGASPVDQTVTLHAIERGLPPAGRSSAVEVRIGDGLNYYFEYRNGENPQIGDRSLPTDDRVLGTDVASGVFVSPYARPAILLLPSDGDDNGAVLAAGQTYREIDASPFPVEFRADVTAINGDRADLRIRYGVNGRPDPSIRPWPASPSRPWQSPDIEVRNAKNLADPAWANVPWVGNVNTVVARVRNAGTIMAPQVRVVFSIKNFTLGGAPEVFLGADIRDIAPGATVEFTTTWVPPATGHFCVIARIPLYVVPTAPAVVEMTELNNFAQSNYDRFNTATSSASTREETVVEVGNPYDKPTRVWIVGEQSNPLYRTYVENRWLWLEPGETRPVSVLMEYALDPKDDRIPDDVRRGLAGRSVEKLTRVPNDLGLHAYAENPDDDPRHTLELLGGAGLQVTTGRATELSEFGNDGNVVVGQVVTSDDRRPVPSGRVVVTVTVEPEAFERHLSVVGEITDGRFVIKLPDDDFVFLRADFLPSPGYAPCAVDWLERRG
ncbi:CARDB domain-containing protein [Paractinoplanes maris]|uniref:CARDB domain-containing protein n=1 Tax=Paractinoplanes maris TaxID=1734446 RepID=UPI00201FD7BD|nr:CARDB domain-containing protein [Actinoplanes maris]